MLGLALLHGEQILYVYFLILVGGIGVLSAVSVLLVRGFKARLGNRAYWLVPIPFVVAAGSLYLWHWTDQPIIGPPEVLVGANAVRFMRSEIRNGSDFGYWGLAFFKGKLYASTNLGLLEIRAGNISNLYRFQKHYSVVSGPWFDAANQLLWVEDEQTSGLASYDGATWKRVPMPRGGLASLGTLPKFAGNSQGFWAVVAGNVWHWDSAAAKWVPEDTPKPPSPGEAVIGVMPLGGQLLFIERHELLPFLVRTSEEFKSDTVVVMDSTWREVPSQPRLNFLADSSVAADDAGYICTTTGDILQVTTEEIVKLDTPGKCEALACASGKLVAGFHAKGIYEYQRGKWYQRAAHPYPSGEGEYWSHLAVDGAELSYAITGKPVVDRTATSGTDIKFTRTAPRALWVLRGPEFHQVMVEGQ